MGEKCPKCGGITYTGFDDSTKICPNCRRISSSKSPEKEEKIEELQTQIEKLMLEHEKMMNVCDTLPKCEFEDSCESCEINEKVSQIEEQIEDLEASIENIEGEILFWEQVEIPEENINEKLKENDFKYLFENELMQYIDKEKLKPHFKAFLDFLYYEEENRDYHQDEHDIVDIYGREINVEEIMYQNHISRIMEKIREYFGEDEIKIFIKREKARNSYFKD